MSFLGLRQATGQFALAETGAGAYKYLICDEEFRILQVCM